MKHIEVANINSIVKEDIKMLFLNEMTTIQGAHFAGINLNLNNIFFANNDLSNFKSQEYDYFFIHGFDLRDFDMKNIFDNNIKIKNFCIDLLGEGFDIHFLLRNHKASLDKFENVKILIPFKEYNIISNDNTIENLEDTYPNYNFFKHRLGGPRLFCSRYNRVMIHTDFRKINKVIMGLAWDDSPKDKLFMCLNNTPRIHRTRMVHSLISHNLLDDGYVTFRDNSKIHGFHNHTQNKWIEYEVPELLIDDKFFDTTNRFGMHTTLTRSCYVDLVTESSHEKLPFKTEKCVKPFYNLQFPIILGHDGIVQDLRDAGFDMFDDIIDHSYDLIKIDNPDHTDSDGLTQKVTMISNELLKLSKMDIHSLYVKNKDRFLYNQENLYKTTITENNIFQALGEFIFGDNVDVQEFNFDKIEKIYL